MSKRKTYPVEQVENRDGSARYEQAADGTITITLTGRIAANLHKAADAMNAVPWCDDDNTAATVLANFVLWQQMQNWNEDGPHYTMGGIDEELEGIWYGIDTDAGDDDELDEERRDELKAALQKAFDVKDEPTLAKIRHAAKVKDAIDAALISA